MNFETLYSESAYPNLKFDVSLFFFDKIFDELYS